MLIYRGNPHDNLMLNAYPAKKHVNVPEVAVHGKNRSADSYNLPDIGQRDHTDYEQESPEV